MSTCRNKGCPGVARRGQYFCYDCYTAWREGGDEAVAARIAEMQRGEQELEALRAFRQKVFDAVLPPFTEHPTRCQRQTEQSLFDTIYAGHYTLSKLRREWYNSPDFGRQNVPKHGPGVRAQRARLMVDWYLGQLDKANKPLVSVRGCTVRDIPSCPTEPHGPQCYRLSGCPGVPVKLCKHPTAKVKDEAEPLRLKVAELEGRLLVAQQGSIPSIFIKVLCIVSMLAGLGFGLLLK